MNPPEHLMIPGPTPLPETVRQAMGRPAIGHRSAEFKEVIARVLPRLQWLFQTKNEVFVYTASATGAMEGAMTNTLERGDQILVLCCGVFSERWAEMAESLGIGADRLSVPYGAPNTVESLREALSGDKKYKAVVITHSETSTGVLNPLGEMIPLVRDHGALSMVDAVTSMGAAPIPVDDWGIDLVVSGSQKGFMIPPGLAFLSVSDRAWEAHRQVAHPGYYFNFTKNKKAQAQFNTAYTPATHLILALDQALALMETEGLEAIHTRHARLRDMTRRGAKALGLELLVKDDPFASTAVTALVPPERLAIADIRAGLKKDFGLVVADGQKDLKGKIFRIGHLGYQSEREVLTTLAALESVLEKLGHPVTPGAALTAARDGKKEVPA